MVIMYTLLQCMYVGVVNIAETAMQGVKQHYRTLLVCVTLKSCTFKHDLLLYTTPYYMVLLLYSCVINSCVQQKLMLER